MAEYRTGGRVGQPTRSKFAKAETVSLVKGEGQDRERAKRVRERERTRLLPQV